GLNSVAAGLPGALGLGELVGERCSLAECDGAPGEGESDAGGSADVVLLVHAAETTSVAPHTTMVVISVLAVIALWPFRSRVALSTVGARSPTPGQRRARGRQSRRCDAAEDSAGGPDRECVGGPGHRCARGGCDREAGVRRRTQRAADPRPEDRVEGRAVLS